MNDTQVWSIIGVLTAALVSMVVGLFTLFLRTMKAQFETVHVEISGLRNEMGARFEAVNERFDARFDTVNARFDTVNARFDTTDHRIDGIDRDIQLVFSKVFGAGGEGL